METVFLLVFFIIFGAFCFYAKKHLYAHEHEDSIREELNTFNRNVRKINELEKEPNHKQSGHLYK